MPAQLVIELPASIEISVNGQIVPVSRGRLDSLRSDAVNGKVHYKIAGIEASAKRAQVRLYIPQVFSLQKVCDQVILYYSMITSDSARLRDHVFIYPYFSEINETPHIICSYRPGGKFFFTVNHWSVLPVPPAPDLRQKLIFNQVIAEMMDNYPIMENVSQEILKKIAAKNKIPVEQVQKIYENTILWQEVQ
jgi:hypothetical protein